MSGLFLLTGVILYCGYIIVNDLDERFQIVESIKNEFAPTKAKTKVVYVYAPESHEPETTTVRVTTTTSPPPPPPPTLPPLDLDSSSTENTTYYRKKPGRQGKNGFKQKLGRVKKKHEKPVFGIGDRRSHVLKRSYQQRNKENKIKSNRVESQNGGRNTKSKTQDRNGEQKMKRKKGVDLNNNPLPKGKLPETKGMKSNKNHRI